MSFSIEEPGGVHLRRAMVEISSNTASSTLAPGRPGSCASSASSRSSCSSRSASRISCSRLQGIGRILHAVYSAVKMGGRQMRLQLERYSGFPSRVLGSQAALM